MDLNNVAEFALAVLLGLGTGYTVTRILLKNGLLGIARDIKDVLQWVIRNADKIEALLGKANADPKTISAMSDRIGSLEQEMLTTLQQVKRDSKTVRTLAGKIGGTVAQENARKAAAEVLQNETPANRFGLRGTPRRLIR